MIRSGRASVCPNSTWRPWAPVSLRKTRDAGRGFRVEPPHAGAFPAVRRAVNRHHQWSHIDGGHSPTHLALTVGRTGFRGCVATRRNLCRNAGRWPALCGWEAQANGSEQGLSSHEGPDGLRSTAPQVADAEAGTSEGWWGSNACRAGLWRLAGAARRGGVAPRRPTGHYDRAGQGRRRTGCATWRGEPLVRCGPGATVSTIP